MVDVYNYIIRVVNILKFIYLLKSAWLVPVIRRAEGKLSPIIQRHLFMAIVMNGRQMPLKKRTTMSRIIL